jgi:hypothetical protein
MKIGENIENQRFARRYLIKNVEGARKKRTKKTPTR